MSSIFQSLLLVIAGSTQRELARQVKYLKVENQILRGKLPDRITVSPKERERLLKFGAKLGKALKHLVTIVTPGTFLRWIRETKKDRSKKPAKRGRPRTNTVCDGETASRSPLRWPQKLAVCRLSPCRFSAFGSGHRCHPSSTSCPVTTESSFLHRTG